MTNARLLSFLDAYSGYHQVPLAWEDEEKTAFITPFGTFCYTTMSFGLRNAGATFQRLMQKTFDPQISRNLEVYVNDIIVKSFKADDHIHDLAETFANLSKNNIKLNPEKCVFCMQSSKVL